MNYPIRDYISFTQKIGSVVEGSMSLPTFLTLSDIVEMLKVVIL